MAVAPDGSLVIVASDTDRRGVSFLAETRRGQLEAAGFAYGDMRRLPELRMREWL